MNNYKTINNKNVEFSGFLFYIKGLSKGSVIFLFEWEYLQDPVFLLL